MSTEKREKSYIAYSGGVESTTMLLMFGHEATPLFADTGWEHQVLYDWLSKVESATGHKIERVRAKETLPDYIKRSRFYPSPVARFCTRMFKIEPMDKFLKERVPCEVMIGLNYGEQDRTGNHGLVKGVRYSYPLIDLKITREMCVDALKEHELYPHFPSYMKRGGCVGCFYKSADEYYKMARESPEEAYGVADLEDSIQDERGRHFGVRDGIPNMRQYLNYARAQQEFPFEIEENEVAPSSCGVFCNR